MLGGPLVLVGVGEQAGFSVWVLGGGLCERDRERPAEGGHAGAADNEQLAFKSALSYSFLHRMLESRG